MSKGSVSFQIRQWMKQAVQNIVLPFSYFLYRGRKIDPACVVFADAHHSQRPEAMELLYRELQKEGGWKIKEHYLDYQTAGAGAVAKHSVSFMKLYAGAGYVVICDNFLPAASCRKKDGTRVIQLWHACGSYKRFGYDAPDDIPPNYRGENVYRNTDLVTVSGKAAVGPFSSAMRLPETCIAPLGVSRTDLLLDEQWRAACRERFFQKYPQARGKKVLLWAPTFRGNAGRPQDVTLDLKALQEEMGDAWFVLGRPHPHMLHGTQGEQEKSRMQDAFCSIPTEEMYPVVDVLIADYSSLVYEYLLFKKPLVLYVPDLEEYRARRGFYMDITQIPAQIVTNREDLPGALERAAKEGLPEERTEQFLAEYMGACDGHATGRIAAWMREHRGREATGGRMQESRERQASGGRMRESSERQASGGRSRD